MPTHTTRPLRFGLPTDDVVIIHHLSDLNHQQASRDNPIFAYSAYLNTLEPEQLPDVVIITGNLTATGKPEDFQGLAGVIQGLFARFDTEISQHVFVVPGMLDLNWEKLPAEYTGFAEAFANFGIPGVDVSHMPPAKYVVFPIDTCYVPTKLSSALLQTLQERVTAYQRLYDRRQQKRTLFSLPPFKKPQPPDVEALRKQYAEASNNLLLSPHVGLITNMDALAFKQQITRRATMEIQNNPPAAIIDPLKILVTHHPLIPLAENNIWTQTQKTFAADLVQTALKYDVQLALHGHAQISQVAAHLSGDAIPLRQLGAGQMRTLTQESNGVTPSPQTPADDTDKKATIFNEIVARYSHKDSRWLLDICTRSLADPQAKPPAYILLNHTGDSADPPEKDSREKKLLDMRDLLDKQLRMAMAQFSDNIATVHTQDILSRPLTTVRDAISGIIFGDCETRVGLAIKTTDRTNNLVALKYAYIEPLVDNHQQFVHPFRYPLTFASWALILGRPLLFPRNYAKKYDEYTLTNQDAQWLTYSNKGSSINRALRSEIQFADAELVRHAGTSYAPEQIDLTLRRERAQKLLENFNHNSMTLQEAYQEPYSHDHPSLFEEFVALPIPLRPESDNVPTLRPEIGVLLIDAYRPPPKEGETPIEEAIFHEERVKLLCMISDLLFVMLTTADKLNRPAGIWHEPAGH